MASILAPHRARTVQRMKAHSTVLCIQDGTDLNYSGLAQCEGLGSIGTNQTGASSAGLHLHSTLVVTTEGLPLGLLDAQFHAPASKAEDDKLPITLWVVHVREAAPPAGTKPVEWFLLTTCKLDHVEAALACVRWYCLRWRIEDWHRVLKSGCAIEALAHKTRTRLERAIAIRLVIGWRIMLMTLLGRTCPALPAEVLFSDIEIEVLAAYAKKND